jgi:hypothetical protein
MLVFSIFTGWTRMKLVDHIRKHIQDWRTGVTTTDEFCNRVLTDVDTVVTAQEERIALEVTRADRETDRANGLRRELDTETIWRERLHRELENARLSGEERQDT